MPTSISNAIKHYLLGLFASAWNGAIGSLAGILGIDAAAAVMPDVIRHLNWHEMFSAFCGAFVLHAVIWLKKHPLPEDFNTEHPVQPPPPPSNLS